MPYKNKESQKESKKRWNEKNREKLLAYARTYNKQYRIKKLAAALSISEDKASKLPLKRGPYRTSKLSPEDEYRRRRDSGKKYRRAYVKRCVIRNTLYANSYKSVRPCPCGEDHIACLVFHHRDPNEKIAGIGELVSKGVGMKKLVAEIAKCEILCTNCHAKFHWKDRQASLRMAA